MIRAALLAFIAFYRRHISSMKRTPSCRYLPTCSEYAHEAIRKHGAVRGGALAVSRVLRCNSFFHGGVHEVPAVTSPVNPRGPAGVGNDGAGSPISRRA